MASTTCQQSLEIVSCLFIEKLSICILSNYPSEGLTREWVHTPRSFSPVLNTVYSVLNLIDYLHIRVPEVGLETFELFGRSLQVTFRFLCRLVGRVGTGGFLNQTRQINWHFWDIKKDFFKQNHHSLCSWDMWDCKKMKIFKGKRFILLLFLTFVMHLLGWKMIVTRSGEGTHLVNYLRYWIYYFLS
jgi:hypothetical protein